MTKQEAQSHHSGTIGEQSRGLMVANSIGTARSGTGLGVRPQMQSASLSARDPVEVDKSLSARLQSISGRQVAFTSRLTFPEAGGFRQVITGLNWNCPQHHVDECLEIVAASMRSAPEDKIAGALYRLRLLTRGREQRSEADREAEAVIWIENLRCWPGDIVLAVLKDWTRRSDGMWWPSWSDIEVELTTRTSKRAALETHLRGSPVALPKPEDKPRSAEEKQADANLMAGLVQKLTPPKQRDKTPAEIEDELAEMAKEPIRVSSALIQKLNQNAERAAG